MLFGGTVKYWGLVPLLVACQDAADDSAKLAVSDAYPVWASISQNLLLAALHPEDYELGTSVSTNS